MATNDTPKKNLYTQDENSLPLKKDIGKNNEKNLFGQGSKTFGGLADAANNIFNSGVNFANGAIQSIADKLKPKSERNKYNNSEFLTTDVSIDNINKDSISRILQDTYNGNLWDAGISAINLYNVGTKWKINLDQLVDKNAYSFKYWYYLDNDLSSDVEGTTKLLSILDTIEDPTILSVSFRLDMTSPLFIGDVETSSGRKAGESPDNSQTVTAPSNLTDFITNYKPIHRELSYALDYYNEFKNSITNIFESPETLDGNEYKTRIFKNHYVFKVDGLDKLDNLFVDYKSSEDRMFGTEQESLTFTLNEDVRMYSNRMAFLYRNLTYSYNMGKKLIPENLLRFNLYIKISDIRNFTRHTSVDDNLRDAIRNNYSRVIYELKDCEFFFPQSLNPSSLTIGGFNGINTDYSSLQMKIKYRKVNRIFYSALYDSNYNKFILGDKYFSPNLTNNEVFLSKTRYGGKNTQKREYSTNNIGKEPGLGEKLDVLKNRGLLINDNNDTALGRFAKTIGNNAVKAGAQVVSDGVQSLKNQINTNIGGSVRSFLQNKVFKKTIDLGYVNNKPKNVREVKTNMSIQTPLTDTPEFSYNVNDSGIIANVAGIPSSATYIYNSNKNPKSSIILDINNPLFVNKNNDEGKVLVSGTTDAYTNTKYKYTSVQPNEDLHPDKNYKFVNPNENLQPSTGHNITTPVEDVNPVKNFKYVNPNEDVNLDIIHDIKSPNENLQNPKGDVITNPDNNGKVVDLNDKINHKFIAPKEDLNGVVKHDIKSPKEDLMEGKGEIKKPSENVNQSINTKINDPNEDINSNTKKSITYPNEDVNPTVDHKYIQPDKFSDLKSFKDYLKKNKGGDNI